MLIPVYTTQFKRDVKKVSQRGYDMDKLKQVIDLLLSEERPYSSQLQGSCLEGTLETTQGAAYRTGLAPYLFH